jgi:hypothetical protein
LSVERYVANAMTGVYLPDCLRTLVENPSDVEDFAVAGVAPLDGARGQVTGVARHPIELLLAQDLVLLDLMFFTVVGHVGGVLPRDYLGGDEVALVVRSTHDNWVPVGVPSTMKGVRGDGAVSDGAVDPSICLTVGCMEMSRVVVRRVQRWIHI